MTLESPSDLDALAALLVRIPVLDHFVGVRGCEVFIRATEAPFCDTEYPEDAEAIVALVNAAEELIRLARTGLKYEDTFRYDYRLGVSRFGPEETEDDVVRLWQHKEAMEAQK